VIKAEKEDAEFRYPGKLWLGVMIIGFVLVFFCSRRMKVGTVVRMH